MSARWSKGIVNLSNKKSIFWPAKHPDKSSWSVFTNVNYVYFEHILSFKVSYLNKTFNLKSRDNSWKYKIYLITKIKHRSSILMFFRFLKNIINRNVSVLIQEPLSSRKFIIQFIQNFYCNTFTGFISNATTLQLKRLLDFSVKLFYTNLFLFFFLHNSSVTSFQNGNKLANNWKQDDSKDQKLSS